VHVHPNQSVLLYACSLFDFFKVSELGVVFDCNPTPKETEG